jgi:hypothetical protein
LTTLSSLSCFAFTSPSTRKPLLIRFLPVLETFYVCRHTLCEFQGLLTLANAFTISLDAAYIGWEFKLSPGSLLFFLSLDLFWCHKDASHQNWSRFKHIQHLQRI